MVKLLSCVLLLASLFVQAACPKDQAYPDLMFPELEITTSMGVITVELDRIKAPLTSNHLLHLVQQKAYDETLIHRVVPDFVIQAGAFSRDFSEVKACGNVINESGNGLKNSRGSLSMARYNDPHSASSSFFINLKDNDNLNPSSDQWGYAVFGYVTSGMDVVDKIATVKREFNNQINAKDVPIEPVTIISIKVKQ